ncbi:PEP-CTERM/exosortase A-associated glycosyltransferase [Chitinivorax tropicus]|uniref:PEP-CTERM/exosortase A-associated glycosyltransferase n=1 Tax=Chitinivorax tropicus TaxID=714531 RepID=A0A840MR17_9PROT|nr:TIGR04063 family PEP-CTERM/XrtA system glycosyltransferase [Chitinivorax tropicus]MBB5018886.1 PEP-CTERM/exosortase A-associated glycosyltransferase [Chitinivorax tropicus]
MRILHILDHSIPLHSGYTFRTAAILREQRKLGWETFHLTSPKQENCTVLEEDVDGLHFYRTPPAKGFMASKPVLSEIALIQATAHRLEEVAKQVRPDVLHAHSPVLNAIPALQVGQKLGIPVVYEVRAFWEDAAVDHGTSKEWGLRYRATRGLETYALKRVQAVTTICEGLRGDIVARGIPADKVTVIPNAVDIEKFQVGAQPDPALQARLGLQGKTVLGFIGSFYAYEGLNVLLDALPLMLRENPDIRLLLTGGGHQETALKQQAQQLGISEQIVFTGRVPNADVPQYYDLVDVLVYPRLPMRLTELVTPLKPLEAMAQGRLVAASDVGGHRELIQPNVTGVLFRADDAADLAKVVLDLAAHPERWPAMKSAGRHYVETERNWANSVSRYQHIYPALLNGKRR